ncbi:MAG TPA: amidohydrolase family protein [Planctomycetota bacterium]
MSLALFVLAFAPGEPVAPREGVLQIQAAEIWTAGGERIQDGLLRIEDGRVRSVSTGKQSDPALPLVRHPGVVTAGLIGLRSQAGVGGELQEDTRSVLAEARAVHAFDPAHPDVARALAAGITALELAPAPGNVVGGLACVVKTSGGRVLTSEASLALSLTSAALGRSTGPSFFVFGAAEVPGEAQAQPDGGPEWSERTPRGNREPTSYAGALALLRRSFAEGQGPFARAKRGDLAVTIEAWDRHEVLRAVELARELGLAGAVRGAPLAGDPAVVQALKESKLGVIVGPYSAGQTRASLESVKTLAAAGVPVAFALGDPARSPEALRLSAARALRAGAPPAAVWKALTEDAAKLAGVGASLGTLAAGREADFVLWSGDPLDLQSRVVAVYVDGQRAWPAPGH